MSGRQSRIDGQTSLCLFHTGSKNFTVECDEHIIMQEFVVLSTWSDLYVFGKAKTLASEHMQIALSSLRPYYPFSAPNTVKGIIIELLLSLSILIVPYSK